MIVVVVSFRVFRRRRRPFLCLLWVSSSVSSQPSPFLPEAFDGIFFLRDGRVHAQPRKRRRRRFRRVLVSSSDSRVVGRIIIIIRSSSKVVFVREEKPRPKRRRQNR